MEQALPPKPANKENTSVLDSLKLDDDVKLSGTKSGIPAAGLGLENKNTLPSVTVQEAGNFTYYFNASNKTLTSFRQNDGNTYTFHSDDGLSVILRHNDNKRDVLVFSNMSDKISKNSSIPNNAFYIDGDGPSKISFDENHNFVIDLKNHEKLVIDGKDGQTILSGPFKLNFNPDDTGSSFKVNYTGKDKLKPVFSLGDKIKW